MIYIIGYVLVPCFWHRVPVPTFEKKLGRDEQAMMDKVEMPVLLMPAGNDLENLKEGRWIERSKRWTIFLAGPKWGSKDRKVHVES